jgi:PAS domain S-box-containing protein
MASQSDRTKEKGHEEDRPVQGRSRNLSDLASVRREDIPTLVHQLQVQHVQLEMQNEELRQAQETLAEACEHYTQLYDFSPAGYVTLTPEGMIEETNLRFCALVGLHRKFIVQRPFSDFVVTEDWEVFQQHCRSVLESGTTHTCKLRFSQHTGRVLVMHVESLRVKDRDSSQRKIQSAMLDITTMEHAEQAMQDSQQKLQYTAAKLLTAQDEERRRIARDLHDDFCQRLATLNLEIALLPKRHPGGWSDPTHQLQPLKAMLVTLLSDLRDFSHDLHPEQTASITLDDALRAYVADFTGRTHIAATYHAALQTVPLRPAISTCLYRVTQEGLTNIHLHAKAKRASVTVNGLPDAIELLIKDDGQGFVPESVPGSHHLGLTSMRERVEQLNGTMKINSRAEWGTTISIQIPLRQVDHAGPLAS